MPVNAETILVDLASYLEAIAAAAMVQAISQRRQLLQVTWSVVQKPLVYIGIGRVFSFAAGSLRFSRYSVGWSLSVLVEIPRKCCCHY
jgi:hypothetical protein